MLPLESYGVGVGVGERYYPIDTVFKNRCRTQGHDSQTDKGREPTTAGTLVIGELLFLISFLGKDIA